MTAITNEKIYLRRSDIRDMLGLAQDASVTDLFRRGKIPAPHMRVGLMPVWDAELFHKELKEMAAVKKGGK